MAHRVCGASSRVRDNRSRPLRRRGQNDGARRPHSVRKQGVEQPRYPLHARGIEGTGCGRIQRGHGQGSRRPHQKRPLGSHPKVRPPCRRDYPSCRLVHEKEEVHCHEGGVQVEEPPHSRRTQDDQGKALRGNVCSFPLLGNHPFVFNPHDHAWMEVKAARLRPRLSTCRHPTPDLHGTPQGHQLSRWSSSEQALPTPKEEHLRQKGLRSNVVFVFKKRIGINRIRKVRT